MRLLVHNIGCLATPLAGGTFLQRTGAWLAAEDGKITALGAGLPPEAPGATVVDAGGSWSPPAWWMPTPT